MTEFTDWAPPATAPAGLAVILPGRNYPAAWALLSFVGRAARQHGWQVRAVSWAAPELEGTADTMTWVGEQFSAAVAGHDGRVLVIGKSLGTCAAALAAERGDDAIWLTPLLHLPEVVAAMAGHPGRQLLCGGTEDPAWDRAVAGSITPDVVEVDGADHGMFAGDAVRTAEIHLEVTRAVDAWMGEL